MRVWLRCWEASLRQADRVARQRVWEEPVVRGSVAVMRVAEGHLRAAAVRGELVAPRRQVLQAGPEAMAWTCRVSGATRSVNMVGLVVVVQVLWAMLAQA